VVAGVVARVVAGVVARAVAAVVGGAVGKQSNRPSFKIRVRIRAS
jgi:hypothetical protein